MGGAIGIEWGAMHVTRDWPPLGWGSGSALDGGRGMTASVLGYAG